jgi:hypothetical protein
MAKKRHPKRKLKLNIVKSKAVAAFTVVILKIARQKPVLLSQVAANR